MADVAAKDASQETAVNLVASLVSLLIITAVGNSLLIFSAMVVLHIVFNYLAVRSVCLRTFNEPRFLQTIHRYLRREVVSTPCEINRNEPIIFYQIGKSLLDLRLCGFQIKLGHSIRDALSKLDCAEMIRLNELYSEFKYIVCPDIHRRRMYVLLREESSPEDVLKSYFHAVVLSIFICSINNYPLSVYERSPKDSPFTGVCGRIQDTEWCRLSSDHTDRHAVKHKTFGSRFQHGASDSLLEYVNTTVNKEWAQLRVGLRQTGWNLDKHLLVTDEWRIEEYNKKK